MALNLSTNPAFTGRITGVTAAYPLGSSKDETSPGANDGTPYIAQRANDVFGMQQALLKAAGITPTGSADTALVSEYLQAIIELAAGRAVWYDDSGAADAYELDPRTNQQAPNSLFDGLELNFIPDFTNTGASTVDPFSLGAVDIKLAGGSTDPAAGDITAAVGAKLTYKLLPAPHFELDIGTASNIMLQVQRSAVKTDTFSVASSTPTAVTGLSVAITAAQAGNKIRVSAFVTGGASNTNQAMFVTVFKDGAVVFQGDAAGSRVRTILSFNFTANREASLEPATITFTDTAADTASHTYQVFVSAFGGTAHVNRTGQDTDNANYPRGISQIEVMELTQ